MLNNIKTLKKYYKVTFNVFFNKKQFCDNKKNLIYMIDFLCQIKILLQSMLKMFEIPGFSGFFSKFLKF